MLKKFFNLFSHFLRICILLFPKILIYVLHDPKNFLFFFYIWVSKKRRILRRFKIRGNNLKKVYLEKVICQKMFQVSSIEEGKLQFCTLLLPVTFLLANFFSKVSKSVKNSELFWYPYSNFGKKKFLGHISTFFET